MIYNKINLFLPTTRVRCYNGKLSLFISSAYKHCSNIKNVCISFLLNKGEESAANFIRSNLDLKFEYVILWYDGGTHLGKFYNYIYDNTLFKEPGTVISMVGDDMEFKTQGWDTKILNAINVHNGQAVVYCDDGNQGKKLCVNLFTTREVVKRTRFPFMCEEFGAYFIDTVWMKVAQKLKILYYLNDVLIYHHHYTKEGHKDETSIGLDKVKLPFLVGFSKVNKYVKVVIKMRTWY